ncbi:MAG: hypothetical protein JRF27_08035 [Deltaproteobacteria bacterium]|nr:hypothetical protein [Deltaproteobacteria bacterium]
MYNKKPWLKFYGNVPESIDYPSITLYEALMNTVERVPEAVAYEFLGYTSSSGNSAQRSIVSPRPCPTWD